MGRQEQNGERRTGSCEQNDLKKVCEPGCVSMNSKGSAATFNLVGAPYDTAL